MLYVDALTDMLLLLIRVLYRRVRYEHVKVCVKEKKKQGGTRANNRLKGLAAQPNSLVQAETFRYMPFPLSNPHLLPPTPKLLCCVLVRMG